MIYSIYKLSWITKVKKLICRTSIPTTAKEVIDIAIERYEAELKKVKKDLKNSNWSYLFAKYPICVNKSPVVGFNTLKIATKEEMQNTINTLEYAIQNLKLIQKRKIQKEEKERLDLFLEQAKTPLINGGFGIDYLDLGQDKKVNFLEILEKEINQMTEITINNPNVTFAYRAN